MSIEYQEYAKSYLLTCDRCGRYDAAAFVVIVASATILIAVYPDESLENITF